jgi:FKBP-type peptidyl-prolyl cis-trans isomerase
MNECYPFVHPLVHNQNIMKKGSICSLLLAWVMVVACQQTEEPFAARKTKDNSADIRNYLTANKINADSTLSGLYYFVQNTNPTAQKPQIGDEITISYVARRLDGVIVDSSQVAYPYVYIRAPEQSASGYRFVLVPAFEELMQAGTEKLREGDKVSLFVPWTLRNSGAASLLAPLYIPLRYDITIKKVRTEDEQIEDYIKYKGLTVTEKASNGLRFLKTQAYKDSTQIKFGEVVKVNYAGRLVSNNRQFDPAPTSLLLTSTFSVTLADTATSNVGASVVKGFNDGIYRLKYGEKGIIIFPSKLGYGTTPKSSIPAYSPLYFEIEANRQ